jgi:voltage-gated potassium channel
VLAIAGVVSIAILTAKISSYFLEQALKERRGFVEEEQLKNHLIICGWKRDMNIFIEQVLAANPDVSSEKIVLVNNMPDSDIESLLLIPGMKKVKVIKGDFFVESVLKRARPQMAKKVLILAGATPNAVGQIPTITEADARTIMTAMTLSNISKSTPVVAEILDAGMDEYLRLANVHEVVYSREYSRMLLSLSSCGVGLTNIFHDLLDPSSVYNLRTYEIPEILVEKTFADLQDYFKSRKNVCLVGVLENSGNTHVAKEMAIRKAQQTPNIAELVRNLQSVKHMRFNRPVFNPSNDYRIGEGAMAIVIEERLG